MDNPNKEFQDRLYISICYTQIFQDYWEFMKGTEKLITSDDYLVYFEKALKKFKEKK